MDAPSVRFAGGVLCLCVAILEVGCATTAGSATGEWQTPRTRLEPYDAVLVVALSPSDRARRAFEETIAKEIAAAGEGRGIPSYSLLAQMGASEMSRDLVVAMARRSKADAVLVTRVVHQTAEDERSPEHVVEYYGSAVAVTQNEDATMTSVMASDRWVEVLPGTPIIRADSEIQSLIYEPGTGDRLVYRASARATFDVGPENPIEMPAAVFARTIIEQLRKDDVIR